MNPEKSYIPNSPEHVSPTKEQRWKEELQIVEQLTDGLGLHVDEGIKETVAAFHMFEINTTASHEGKINRHPIPYIDVHNEETKMLYEKFRNFRDTNKEDKEGIEILRREITRLNLDERKKIIPLLEEFYLDRKTPYEIRLGIRSLALGWSRVQSLGADFQEIEDDEEIRKEKLRQFQEEMHTFTEFLKNKYFSKE